MTSLTLTLPFIVAACCAAMTLCQRSRLRASGRQADLLRPELTAAIRNAGSAELVELCRRYPRCGLARIANEAVLRAGQLGGPVTTRTEILRIVLNQACIREAHRLNFTSTSLRAVAFLSAAIGMMVAASNTADALGFVYFCEPVESVMGGDISEAVATLIAGTVLSLFGFVLDQYVESCRRAEITLLQNDSSALLCDLLSRK